MIFKTQVLLAAFAVSLSAVSLAATINNNSDIKPVDSKYYAGVSLAGSYNPVNSNVVVPPAPDSGLEPAQYIMNRGDTIYADFGAHFGKIRHNGNWSTHYGLGIYISASQTIHGKFYVMQGQGATSTFQYNLNTDRFMLETNMFYQTSHKLTLFYGFGVGMAHIRTGDFQFTSLVPPSQGQPTPPKTEAHIQIHVAASVDAGLDFPIASHWHLDTTLQQLWIGENAVSVENGSGNLQSFHVASLTPWQVKLGLTYTF